MIQFNMSNKLIRILEPRRQGLMATRGLVSGRPCDFKADQ
jgi:hypothetical protein